MLQSILVLHTVALRMVFQIEGLHGSKHWNITVTAFETWIHSCSQELEIEINNENGVKWPWYYRKMSLTETNVLLLNIWDYANFIIVNTKVWNTAIFYHGLSTKIIYPSFKIYLISNFCGLSWGKKFCSNPFFLQCHHLVFLVRWKRPKLNTKNLKGKYI